VLLTALVVAIQLHIYWQPAHVCNPIVLPAATCIILLVNNASAILIEMFTAIVLTKDQVWEFWEQRSDPGHDAKLRTFDMYVISLIQVQYLR